MSEDHSFVDKHQSYWQLACIQITSIGLPGILIGGALAKQYGPGTALLSICVGNLILWLIAISIITMTTKNRNNAIENVKVYLGKIGSKIAVFILVIAFIAWYLFQLKIGTSAIHNLFSNKIGWQKYTNLRFGVFLGMLTALLAMGGIRLIKWICIIFFPLVFIFPFYGFLTASNPLTFQNTWGISFTAVIIVVAENLAATVNLPTFFRHSRSRAHSYLALILMTIFFSMFQIFGMYINISDTSDFFANYSLHPNPIFYLVLVIPFILASTICVNLINIYFSSAGWELIFPHRWNPKEYAIVGLFGTAGYAFLQASSPMILLENITANWIASLGIVLLLAFLVKIVAKHRPRPQEKLINGICWLIGCATALITQFEFQENHIQALLSGVNATVISFIGIFFIEELIWTLKKFRKKN